MTTKMTVEGVWRNLKEEIASLWNSTNNLKVRMGSLESEVKTLREHLKNYMMEQPPSTEGKTVVIEVRTK